MNIFFYDALTDVSTEREMNSEELAEHTAHVQKMEDIKAEKAAQIEAKKALLLKLGITKDEAKLLLS